MRPLSEQGRAASLRLAVAAAARGVSPGRGLAQRQAPSAADRGAVLACVQSTGGLLRGTRPAADRPAKGDAGRARGRQPVDPARGPHAAPVATAASVVWRTAGLRGHRLSHARMCRARAAGRSLEGAMAVGWLRALNAGLRQPHVPRNGSGCSTRRPSGPPGIPNRTWHRCRLAVRFARENNSEIRSRDVCDVLGLVSAAKPIRTDL